MWGQPPRLSAERSEALSLVWSIARVERALLPAAFDFALAFAFAVALAFAFDFALVLALARSSPSRVGTAGFGWRNASSAAISACLD
jgi:hypothetical protein